VGIRWFICWFVVSHKHFWLSKKWVCVCVFLALRCSLPVSGQSVLSEGGGEWEGFPHEHSRKWLIPGVSVWSLSLWKSNRCLTDWICV